MTEGGKEKPTFSSRLKEKRLEKGWSQYQLAALSGCTNSNVSYLEKHPGQKPKLETVEGLAGALAWDINETRRLAGYRESDDNLTPLEVEDDFRLALHDFKGLSDPGREMVKKQIRRIIDFVSECERGSSGLTMEDQASGTEGGGEVSEIKLDYKQIRKKESKKK
jgi:transcriptional regulator with XRE-family HTH domain